MTSYISWTAVIQIKRIVRRNVLKSNSKNVFTTFNAIEIVWSVNLCSMIVIGLPTSNYVSLTSNGWILFAMCGLLLKLDRWGNCIVGYSIGIYGNKTIQSISLEWMFYD
jgi:hypothetical protein